MWDRIESMLNKGLYKLYKQDRDCNKNVLEKRVRQNNIKASVSFDVMLLDISLCSITTFSFVIYWRLIHGKCWIGFCQIEP